jgi:ABC-type multidrug transport system fused ATPase/permease subunit
MSSKEEKHGQRFKESDPASDSASDISTEDDSNGFKIVYLDGSDTPVVVRPHNVVTKTLLGTKIKPVPEERQPCPKNVRNPLSALTWSWVFPLLRTGFNRILEPKDIFLIPEDEQNERRMTTFKQKLHEYKYSGNSRPYAEFWAMLYAVRWDFLLTFVTAAFFVAGEMGMSLMSRTLISLVEAINIGQTKSHGHATGFAIGSTIVQLCFQFFLVWNQYRSRVFSEIVRTMLISAVYDKITKLSPTGRQLYPPSKITSLITTDTNRVFMASRWTPLVLIFLPAYGGMLGILVSYLGVSGLPGCGLVLLGIIINILISRIITKLRMKSLPFADSRIATVRETVENMRVIKFYGWESSFVNLVSAARNAETGYLKKLSLIEGIVDACLTSIPQFGGALSFAVRIIIGNGINPTIAFPALTLFQLFVPLSMMFSVGVTSHADAWTSVKRLNDFFNAPEEPNYVITEGVTRGSIKMKDADFKWDLEAAPLPVTKSRWRRRLLNYKSKAKAEDEITSDPTGIMAKPFMSARDNYEQAKDETNETEDVETSSAGVLRAGARKFPGLNKTNLDIIPGELIMVTGSIGSGKTTLLNAIVGSVSKSKGSVEVGGQVSTVMSMWSQNATIRHNILFGLEYDADRYARTVYACSLESDFDKFEGRDFSEVGERGITLSGGQKARIALARCVYAGGDIVLLDDVLSAVDGKVSNHIFTKCINGILKGATRIMVTHNVNLLKYADRIIYMNGNGDTHIDTLDNLIATEPQFSQNYSEYARADESELKEAMHEQELVEKREKVEDYDEDLESYKHVLEKVNSQGSAESNDFVHIKRHKSRPDPELKGKLTQEEQRQIGAVKGEILYFFLKSGSRIGIAFCAVIIFFQFGVAAAQVMQSVFLRLWTSNKYHEPNGFYIGIYCLIVFCRALFFVSMAISIASFCYNSSSKLHNKAIETVYKAPMSYFDSTPLGRIINRFTDDVANLDTQLFMQLRMSLFSFSMLIASIVVVFVTVPWAILALAPILLVAFVMLNFYRASAREFKRINSLFRSSMFTLVTETISGISVILSYGRKEIFASELNKRIDDMNISFQINIASQYWLSLRMAWATTSVTLIVTLMCVYQVFDLDASKTGMLMSLLPSVSISVVMLLPMLTELENQLNSVERLYELGYSLPQEAPSHIAETAPPESWPQSGAITLQNVSLKYRPELPLVLNDVSLQVKGGEKIGICGRTGAGKSTMLSVLFRITELYQGRVFIDGVDISQIGLRDLRTQIAIIPQEPVLFQGTIRSNLDPFNGHSDAELWDALRRSGVIRHDEFGSQGQVTSQHRFHLDAKADSDGSNFSLGERQLLTLARALVRNAKVLVLDEATATVDFETDAMIQATIGKEFKDCTIMCIAHRIQTIVNYDRVMVMDAGRIAEIGPPKELFDDKTSVFSGMCSESGISKGDFL